MATIPTAANLSMTQSRLVFGAKGDAMNDSQHTPSAQEVERAIKCLEKYEKAANPLALASIVTCLAGPVLPVRLRVSGCVSRSSSGSVHRDAGGLAQRIHDPDRSPSCAARTPLTVKGASHIKPASIVALPLAQLSCHTAKCRERGHAHSRVPHERWLASSAVRRLAATPRADGAANSGALRVDT